MSCQLDEKPPLPQASSAGGLHQQPAAAAAAAAVVAAAARQACGGDGSGHSGGSSSPSAMASSASTACGVVVKDEPRVGGSGGGPVTCAPAFTKDMNYRRPLQPATGEHQASMPYDRQPLQTAAAAGCAGAMPAFAGVRAARPLQGGRRRDDDSEDDDDDGKEEDADCADDEGGGGAAGSERLRNDLLDEICNDMGIQDSMELDFYDFPSGGPASPAGPHFEDRRLAATGGGLRGPAVAPGAPALGSCRHPSGAPAAPPQPHLQATAHVKRESVESEQRQQQPMDCMQQQQQFGTAASFPQPQQLQQQPVADKEQQSQPSSGGAHHRTSPDLLAGLRQSGATDDSKFSMSQQQLSSKATPQRQQSRNDCSPYQVPSKQQLQQQQLQQQLLQQQQQPYYLAGGSADATAVSGGGSIRRTGSGAAVDGSGGMLEALSDPSWMDGGVGTRWTSYATFASGAGGGAQPMNGHHHHPTGYDADGSVVSASAAAVAATAAAAAVAAGSASQAQHEYPDDFCMEDLTAPDSTINFSEMPQQPNYYQVPNFGGQLSQSGQFNISFNMSLSSSGQQQQQQQLPPIYQSPAGRVVAAAASTSGASQCPPPYLRRQVSAPVMHGNGVGQQSGVHHHQAMQQQQQLTTGSGIAYGSAASLPGRFPASAPVLPTNGQSYRVPASSVTAAEQQQMMTVAGAGVVGPAAAQHPTSAAGSKLQQQQQQLLHQQQPVAAPSTHDFMQRLVLDKSSAFRSHPLFPLLRDLIIADMNFHEPSFPHQLIRDLPADFSKLLKNYMSRNPQRATYQVNQSVESVVMDALRFAHHSLIDKIQQKRAAAAAAASTPGAGGAAAAAAVAASDSSSSPPLPSPPRRAPTDAAASTAGTPASIFSGSGAQQQLSSECASSGVVAPSSSSSPSTATAGHSSMRRGLDADKFDAVGLKREPEQATNCSSSSSSAPYSAVSSPDGVLEASAAHASYRQPLTVDISCGAGQSPLGAAAQQQLPGCYVSARPATLCGGGATSSLSRSFGSQRPSANQPGSAYAISQQQHQSASMSVTGAGYQSAYGDVSRDPSGYYNFGCHGGGAGAAPASADGGAFQQQMYQTSEHAAAVATLSTMGLQQRQHQPMAMSGAPYGNGGGGMAAANGLGSPLYPQAYSHLQNGIPLGDRSHEVGTMYGDGYIMKPVLDPGKMSRGYVSNAGGAGSTGSGALPPPAHCVDYGRSGRSSGLAMSDMLGSGLPSAASACMGLGNAGHHHPHHLGHLQPGSKLGALTQQQIQSQAGMAAASSGGSGGGSSAEGATRKHQSLPKEAVSVMLSWLKEHQDKPYPNDDEKSALIKQTGLSITQINYWFTNARRRLLPKWRGEDI